MHSAPGFPHSLLEYVNRPPGYQQLLQAHGLAFPAGENVLHADWDLCVVLDACREDLFRAALADGWRPPAPYSYRTTTSLDSATQPWVERTVDVDPDAVEPVTYVCANPFGMAAEDAAVVETYDEVWRYGWDDQLRTVPPAVVTDRAVHHCRETDGRVLVHYLQPHMPAIRRAELGAGTDVAGDGGTETSASAATGSTTGDGTGPTAGGPTCETPATAGLERQRRDADGVERAYDPYGDPEHAGADAWFAKAAGDDSLLAQVLDQWDRPGDDPGGRFEDLRFGGVDHDTVWAEYRECLAVVLEEVDLLLRAVDADDVLVTSDHGNAFGEWGVYAHPYHLRLEVLREVPALWTSASADVDYEFATERVPDPAGADGEGGADERVDVTDEDVEERLAALGYT